MNINWTLQRLNIWVFRRFICIWLHRLSFLDNPTNKEYILQKKSCHLDQNWQSYVEIYILFIVIEALQSHILRSSSQFYNHALVDL